MVPTIAYTYSEPVFFYEYMLDTAKLGRSKGIGSVMISNGFINEAPLMELCRHLTGVKIDLKGFSEKFYKEYCSGELKPVLDTLKRLRTAGIWYEIVVLLIPTLNDSGDEIRQMCGWIKSELGVEVRVHFTRFHPMYKIQNLPSTPVKTLEEARTIARETGLHYVYLGNVPGHEGENTYCPKCHQVVIGRVGFHIVKNVLTKGAVDSGKPVQEMLRRLAERGRCLEITRRILTAFSPKEEVRISQERSARPAHDPLLNNLTLAEPLTSRELDVLALLREPLSNKEIAEKLHISYPTAKRHTINIYAKLGVNGRWNAVARAVELGILPSEVYTTS